MQKKTFDKEFKLEIMQELAAGKNASQVALEHDLKKSLIWTWRREYDKNPEHAFSGHGQAVKEEARKAELERKIGKQAMEIDFLKKVNKNLQKLLAESKKNVRQKT